MIGYHVAYAMFAGLTGRTLVELAAIGGLRAALGRRAAWLGNSATRTR